MKDWVKRKLDKIDELYPPERINSSKERWRKVWRGEKPSGRYPFAYANMLFNYYDDVHTPEERMRMSLDEIIARGRLNDDYIPSIFPGCRQATIPTMFGAKEVICGRDYTCEKIIHSYEDIDKLPEPYLGSGTVACGWLEMQKYLLEETGGRVPIHVTDMQGPTDVAGQLWGYSDLFIAAYEEPEYYHRLMTKLTQAFILFWKGQKDILGDCFVGTHLFGWDWVPEDMGVSISADSIVMVSPDFFDEFFKPYIEAIGKELGDISLHSCGDFSQVLKNLVAISGLRAINAGQMTVEQLIKAGLDGRTMSLAISDFKDAAKMFSMINDYSLKVGLSIIGIWPSVDGSVVTWPSPFCVPVMPDEMNGQLWDEVKRKDEIMQQYAVQCVSKGC